MYRSGQFAHLFGIFEDWRDQSALWPAPLDWQPGRQLGIGNAITLCAPGQIVVLNGPPRSGKSSIAHAIQNTFDGVWMNLGVDGFKQMTPERFQPGIGLRPGGERPDLEPLVASALH
jgi:hypothetical protein